MNLEIQGMIEAEVEIKKKSPSGQVANLILTIRFPDRSDFRPPMYFICFSCSEKGSNLTSPENVTTSKRRGRASKTYLRKSLVNPGAADQSQISDQSEDEVYWGFQYQTSPVL